MTPQEVTTIPTRILPAAVLGKQGQPVVNSKHLANHFGKQHKVALRDIDRLMGTLRTTPQI